MNQEHRILGALRMGVIPDSNIADFMVSRESELNELNGFIEAIKDGDCRVKFIKGAYGTGKTFLMKYLTEEALKHNFIVANVPIHSGFGFTKFDGVYNNIMTNLMVQSGNTESTSFEMIFEKWIRELKTGENIAGATQNIYRVINELSDYNSSFSNVLLVYIRALINKDYELTSTAAAWIKGDKNLPYQLKRKLNVKGSVDNENALDIFKGFVRLVHLLGYAGIIINFDEAELIMQQRSDMRLKAYTNIRQLIDSAGAGQFEYAGLVFAGTEEFFDDEEKGIKCYGALAQRLGDLMEAAGVENVRQPILSIKSFTKEEYTLLAKELIEIHEKSFDYSYEGNVDHLVNLTMLEATKQLKGNDLSTRVFLKKLIELLDLMKDNPELPIFRALRNRV